MLGSTVLVFGQMNEPPGARFRVGHAALTMAEYFRDDAHQDVLLLIDNIFRFMQAGIGGLGPARPARRRAWATSRLSRTELAELEERICTTGARRHHLGAGGVRAGRRFHRSGGHAHLRPPVGLDRALPRPGQPGALPGHRPAAIRVEDADAAAWWASGITGWRSEVRSTLAEYDDLKDVIAMLGLEELSREDQRTVHRARRLERFLTQPFFTTEPVHRPARTGRAAGGDARRLRAHPRGRALPTYPRSAFYMIGGPARPRVSHDAQDPRPRPDGPGASPSPGGGRGRERILLPVAPPCRLRRRPGSGDPRLRAGERRRGPARGGCGILVKCGAEVLVSTRAAVRGTDLGLLRATVRDEMEQLDDREVRARAALAKLEASFIRSMLELEEAEGEPAR